jgi:hypothetical protein
MALDLWDTLYKIHLYVKISMKSLILEKVFIKQNIYEYYLN